MSISEADIYIKLVNAGMGHVDADLAAGCAVGRYTPLTLNDSGDGFDDRSMDALRRLPDPPG